MRKSNYKTILKQGDIMEKTICIKGVGKVKTKPDLIVIPLSITSKSMTYGEALENTTTKISQLKTNITRIGLEADCLKTTNFSVSPEYHNEKDNNGNYISIFDGYSCRYDIKIEFDLDMKLLSNILSALSADESNPKFNVLFTIKDAKAVSDEMLRSAAVDARNKAEILCCASNAALGELLRIDYNWGEIDVYSHTSMDTKMLKSCDCDCEIDIDPEDIETADSATFVWEILKK